MNALGVGLTLWTQKAGSRLGERPRSSGLHFDPIALRLGRVLLPDWIVSPLDTVNITLKTIKIR